MLSQQQNKNQATAISTIDTALADESLNEVAREALLARKEELLKNPEVQELNAQKLEAFRAKQAQDAMEEQAFLEKNMPALREAVNDPERANEIIASAPAASQDSLRQTYNSMREFQSIDETTALFAEVETPMNMDLIDLQVNQIPEELRAGQWLRPRHCVGLKDVGTLTAVL